MIVMELLRTPTKPLTKIHERMEFPAILYIRSNFGRTLVREVGDIKGQSISNSDRPYPKQNSVPHFLKIS